MNWLPSSMLLFTLLATCAHASPVAAEDAPTHLVEARLSLGTVSMRDDTLIPYAFTGPAVTLGGRYQVQAGEHAFDTLLLASAAPVFTREGEQGMALVHELAARYAHHVASSGRRVTAIGPSARYAHEYAYLAEWDDAHGYWLASLLAGLVAKHREPLFVRADLELNLDLGLIGVRSRPPERRLNKQDALTHVDFYFNRLGKDPEFAWIASTVVVRAEALVRFRRAKHPDGSGFGVGYETRFSWADEPKPFADWYNGALVAYAWSWP